MLIDLNVVVVSCENKEGLVDNSSNPSLPKNGFLGYLAENNPKIIFLSSGGTYELLKSRGFNVVDFEEYTNAPQMRHGLVKSIDYKIHSSVLAQDFNKEDMEFLSKNKLMKIDAVITNFNNLDIDSINKIDSFDLLEQYRNRIDIGGPLMCMTSRKAFLNTLLLTDPSDYEEVIRSMIEESGKCSLNLRIKMLKKSSRLIKDYTSNISKLYDKVSENMTL
ncbi:hypothetical protein [Streptococcus salivarius]|jgi:phosphoribosylaminoimidazolecarboxamide formyltransferase/IMP cyclohydrolase|uniref:hypothetical protein n=1 Tax=Streptococcus salivarius TaxID=1304 RepID=UPI0022E739EA|nr:hypothetical protein [Streptococcus salivarius]